MHPTIISIHKALAGLDKLTRPDIQKIKKISIHKALAGLDDIADALALALYISIHKALAGLDPSGR